MHDVIDRFSQLTKPGIFITGTDTGVGKTVIACALAWNLRRQWEGKGASGTHVGVCKPIASGCRREREGLVSADAEALAFFADCRQPLDVINPVRYATPVAPAVAAEESGHPVDWPMVARSLAILDQWADVMIVEGVGGLLVPIDDKDGRLTVLDLAAALPYPVLVVTRAGLGTLNHTAMTVRLLKERGCRIAGLVITGYVADASTAPAGTPLDASMASNRVWLERMNRVPILATVPACAPSSVDVQNGRLNEAVLEAMGTTYWPRVVDCVVAGRSSGA